MKALFFGFPVLKSYASKRSLLTDPSRHLQVPKGPAMSQEPMLELQGPKVPLRRGQTFMWAGWGWPEGTWCVGVVIP